MPKPKKIGAGEKYFSYEVIAQEDSDNVLIPIPPQLLKELNWKEGEKIQITLDETGRFVFKKA